jgi:membrane associated rhomboid family serine protease
MISVNTFRGLHKLLHPHVSNHSGIPPVLTGSLLVFMTLFCAATYIFTSPLESLSLSAATVKNFEPNRLTWYPLLHYNIFHLILSSYLLYPMLATFEKFNGTIRTGIVLNSLATVAGVLYILSQLVLSSESSVIGSR